MSNNDQRPDGSEIEPSSVSRTRDEDRGAREEHRLEREVAPEGARRSAEEDAQVWREYRGDWERGLDLPWVELGGEGARLKAEIRALLQQVDEAVLSPDPGMSASAGRTELLGLVEAQLDLLRCDIGDQLAQVRLDPTLQNSVLAQLGERLQECQGAVEAQIARLSREVEASTGVIAEVEASRAAVDVLRPFLDQAWPELGGEDATIRAAIRALADRSDALLDRCDRSAPPFAPGGDPLSRDLARQIEAALDELRGDVGLARASAHDGSMSAEVRVGLVEASLRDRGQDLDRIQAQLDLRDQQPRLDQGVPQTLHSEHRADETATAQWRAAWDQQMVAARAALEARWPAFGPDEAAVKASLSRVLDEAAAVEAKLARAPQEAVAAELREPLARTLISALRAVESLHTLAQSGTMRPEDAAATALEDHRRRLAALREVDDQRVSRELPSTLAAEARVETRVEPRVEARVEARVDEVQGAQVSPPQLTDAVLAIRGKLDLQAEAHPEVATAIAALHERLDALSQRVERGELSAAEAEQRVASQLSVIESAESGLQSATRLLQASPPDSEAAHAFAAARDQFIAALSASDDATRSHERLQDGAIRIARAVQTEGIRQAESALEAYDARLREIFERTGTSSTLNLADLATDQARTQLRELSQQAQDDDAQFLRGAMADARRLIDQGDFETAGRQLALIQTRLIEVSDRARLVGQLDVTLTTSEGLAAGVGAINFPFSEQNNRVSANRDDLLALLERYERDPHPDPRAEVMRDLDRVYARTPGVRELFDGVQAAFAGLVPPNDPERTAMLAQTLGRVREKVEAGDLEAAAQALRATLSAAQLNAPASEHSALVAATDAAMEALRTGRLAEAGAALLTAAKADYAAIPSDQLAEAQRALGALWERTGAERQDADAQITTARWNTALGVGVLLAATLASMAAGSAVSGAAASWLGTGIGATQALPMVDPRVTTLAVKFGSLLAEATAFTGAERTLNSALLGHEATDSFIAAVVHNAILMGTMKEVDAAWSAASKSYLVGTRWLGKAAFGTGTMTLSSALEHYAHNNEWASVDELRAMALDNAAMLATNATVGFVAGRAARATEIAVAKLTGFSPALRQLEANRSDLQEQLDLRLRQGATPSELGELLSRARDLEDLRGRLWKDLSRSAQAQGWTTAQRDAIDAAVRDHMDRTRQLDDQVRLLNLGVRAAVGDGSGATQLYDPGRTLEVIQALKQMGMTDVVEHRLPSGQRMVSALDEARRPVQLFEARSAMDRGTLDSYNQWHDLFQLQELTRERLSQAGSTGERISMVRATLDRWEALEPKAKKDIDQRRVLLSLVERASAEPSVDDLALIGGLQRHLSEDQVARASATLKANGDNWRALVEGWREQRVSGVELMMAGQLRKDVCDPILREAARRVEQELAKEGFNVKITMVEFGSITLTSDRDLSAIGLGAERVVRYFNEAFRQRFGKESGVVFDTNVYTDPVWTIFDAQQADQRAAVARDPARADALRQFVFATSAASRKLPLAEWNAWTAELLTLAKQADAQDPSAKWTPLLTRVIEGAQRARDGSEQLIRNELTKMGLPVGPPSPDQLAKASNLAYERVLDGLDGVKMEAAGLDQQLAQRDKPIRVRFLRSGGEPEGNTLANSAYLAKVKAINEAREAGDAAGEATAISEARGWLASQARNRQAVANGLASEALQSKGGHQHVVGELQAQSKTPTYADLLAPVQAPQTPAEYMSSLIECAAFRVDAVEHTRDAQGKLAEPDLAISKVAKNFLRELDAAHRGGVDLSALRSSAAYAALDLDGVMRATADIENLRGDATKYNQELQNLRARMTPEDYAERAQRLSTLLTFELLKRTGLDRLL